MSVADVERLIEHWKYEPPVEACIRSYLGVKSRPQKSKPAQPIQITEEQWRKLISAAGVHEEMFGRLQ